MNDLQTILNISTEEAESLGRWWAMWKTAHEVGLLAQRQLLEAGAITMDERLFFNRAERVILDNKHP